MFKRGQSVPKSPSYYVEQVGHLLNTNLTAMFLCQPPTQSAEIKRFGGMLSLLFLR